MFVLNRFFVALDNAIRLSQSDLPQEKQIAVILFDHMIEIVLFNAVRASFEWPGVLSIQEVLDAKSRKNILHKYDTVIAFLKKHGYIQGNDQALLSFTHGIRNEIYHKGSSEIEKTILALSIYFDFIKKNKAALTRRHGLTGISSEPGHHPIEFGQGLPKDPLEQITGTEEYISKTFDFLISKLPELGRFQDLANQYCAKLVTDIERNLEYIRQTSKTLNFYDAIASSTLGNTAPVFREFARKGTKPKSIDSILLTSEYFRNYEEILDDYSSAQERMTRSKSLLKQSRAGKKGKYPYWLKMPRIKERIAKLKKDSIEVAIQNFGGITSELNALHQDSSFASVIFDGYEMVLFDRYRGK
ncbi:MAG: hypothetical protein J0I32_10865 [Sphingobacteriales bacterium]|nr:hypothetical protein [Sphingobacteriales bacterium]OJW01217.1 MAG: hypothetical protein BGO52_07230 [Sphingobacteriales bacterium 44-61]